MITITISNYGLKENVIFCCLIWVFFFFFNFISVAPPIACGMQRGWVGSGHG